MPSRRRVANKNLANNLAEVQRRLRTLERRPVRSKLGNRSVGGTAISPNSVDSTQVSFGINLVAQVDPITGDPVPILNPQDGQQVIDPYSGTTSTYSEEYNAYFPSTSSDLVAQSIANNALSTADGKNKIFYANSAPASDTSYTLIKGDLWFDTSNGYQLSQYDPALTPKWSAFKLGSKAIDKIEANQILAGTITATLRIQGPEVIAGTITGATITGGLIQTSDSGARVTLSNSDDLTFYNINGSIAATISPFDYGQPGVVVAEGISIYTPDYNEWFRLNTKVLDMGVFVSGGSGANITMYGSGSDHGNTDSQMNIGATNVSIGTNVSLGDAFGGTVYIKGQLQLSSTNIVSTAPSGTTDGSDGDVRFVL